MGRGGRIADKVGAGKSGQLRSRKNKPEFDGIGTAIRANLPEDLLKPEYRGAARPFTGHCYVASEAYYHMNGGSEAGLKAVRLRHEGSTHWWIEDSEGNRTDLTAEQFLTPVPYEKGVGAGFLTKAPSKRAQTVIDQVKKELS